MMMMMMMMIKKNTSSDEAGQCSCSVSSNFGMPLGYREILLFCEKKFMQTTLDFIGKGFRVPTILIINGTSTEDDMIIRFTSYRVGHQRKKQQQATGHKFV